MITTGLLYLIYGVVLLITAPLRALPDVSLPTSFTSAVSTASGYISGINTFIPVDSLLIIFGTMLTIELAVLSYKLIVWVLTKIPGISN